MPSLTKSLAVLVGLTAVLEARPAPNDYVLHEKRDGPSTTWIKRDRVAAGSILPVKIGLKQRNLDNSYAYLLNVSDPSSPNYAKYWTEEQVHEVFAPQNASVAAVRRWLDDAGITAERITHSVNRGWLHFDATAAEAEKLLKTRLHELEHRSTGAWSIGSDEYHLPAHIAEHIDYVTPAVKNRPIRKTTLTKRASPRAKRLRTVQTNHTAANSAPPNTIADCNSNITPICITALYDIPAAPSPPVPGNAMGIFEEDGSYAQEDLDLFFQAYTKIPKGTHPTLDSIDGGQAPSSIEDVSVEADLDFELAYPIIYPQELVLYQVDDGVEETKIQQQPDNDFLDALDGSYCNWTAYGETGNDPDIDPTYPDPQPGGYKGKLMCGTFKPTNVISISYGVNEIDLPAFYQERQCIEYLKLALRGVSVFVASGDTGVAGIEGQNNLTNNDDYCIGQQGTVFSPSAPNVCPYVTNVGATMIPSNGSVAQGETAALVYQDGAVFFASSGGFSNVFAAPAYQKPTLDAYFARHNPPYPYYDITGGWTAEKTGNKGVYNRGGHGIPDLSANGAYIAIWAGGEETQVFGTSASAPIVGSVFNRINEERLKRGKRPVGFVNPVLYAFPYILNDITTGSNPGCNTAGFEAVPGWDPVTGLGTPNYPKMLDLYLALP